MKKKIIMAVIILLFTPVVIYFAFPEVVFKLAITLERKSAGLTEKELKVGDHTISYLEGGQGESILLIHGFSANKDNWDQFAKYLTDHYHVVVIDLPGHGESSQLPTTTYSIKNQTDMLGQFIDKIALDRFHIAGNSMGGNIAGEYTIRSPEKVLTLGLFNTGGVRSPEKSEMTKAMEKNQQPLIVSSIDDFDHLMSYLFVKVPYMPRPIKEYFITQTIKNKAFNEKMLRDIMNDLFSLQDKLGQIKTKTLILWGDQDRIIHVSAVKVLENALINSKTVIMKDCGHVPMVERPEETANHYLNFIK